MNATKPVVAIVAAFVLGGTANAAAQRMDHGGQLSRTQQILLEAGRAVPTATLPLIPDGLAGYSLNSFSATAGKTAAADASPSATDDFDGTVIERKLGEGPAETISVTQGTSVRLVLHAPEGTELHLHGYDLSGTAGAGAPVIMTFDAHHLGRFAIEAHGVHDALGRKHKALAYIEVRPE